MSTNSAQENINLADIAIIGIACHFPGAENTDEYWNNLINGKENISRFSEEIPGLSDIRSANRHYVNAKPVIQNTPYFDADFFKISSIDASFMDPQHRLLLQSAWHAFENAGYIPSSIKGKVGVFLTSNFNTYQHLDGWLSNLWQDHTKKFSERFSAYTGNISDTIATRISYKLGLTGPSLTVQTACSGSLVAIHLACQSLLLEESDLAIAGAAALSFPEKQGYVFEDKMILSKDGHCKAFDKDASGTVFGNGVATVLLKPLDKALRDGDHIYAVIKGSAINNDGSRKVDFNAPSVDGQVEAIEAALLSSNISPETIGYIEAHGTGTLLGDPIEMAALTKAYQKHTSKKQFCGIGSVKTNIGHLDAASGMASFIKLALALYHKKIPPIIHYSEPNPQIDFENSPFYVIQKAQEWESKGSPRRGALNCLGIGGTNAHVIMEEGPTATRQSPKKQLFPILLSAKTKEQLLEYIHTLKSHLTAHLGSLNLSDIAFTLLTGRVALKWRFATTASSVEELIECLEKVESKSAASMMVDSSAKNSNIKTQITKIAGKLAKKTQEHLFDWLTQSKPAIDWMEIFKNSSAKRIDLPGYPFAKKIYWYDQILSDQQHRKTSSDSKTHSKLLEDYVIQLFSEETKIAASQISLEDELEKFHIDSITALSLRKRLEHDFGPVPATLFFGFRKVVDVVHFLAKNFANRTPSKSRAGSQNVSPGIAINPAETHKGPLNIAIIGLSGRFPQSPHLAEFWEHLSKGQNLISEIPENRWDHAQLFSEKPGEKGKTYTKWGGFIEDIDKFDPLFFKISPREAEVMDPQERLFLEIAWETLEDAGYTRKSLNQLCDHHVGVYVGATYQEYQLYAEEERLKGNPLILNGINSSIANRVSFFFDFRGPSFAIDTMCSSSLSAIYLACQDLANQKIKAALVGGVNLNVHPYKYLQLAHDGMLSSKGYCHSFGKGGDGYVPAECISGVLLKPLEDAIQCGDHIYGVIKAVAVNHGGKANSFTSPNIESQASVIGEALRDSGIDPQDISYLEAHGTGTALGDPIEIEGLTRAFRPYTSRNQFCSIGSVKSNIGHAESAAALAGLTKILLQMKHKKLVPSLHSKELNPYINFQETPFAVQQSLQDWERTSSAPLTAALSSFGAGGSNGHMIIQEYCRTPQKRPSENRPALIVLSAQNADRLKAYLPQFLRFLELNDHLSLSDIAYTLQIGREPKEFRVAFSCDSIGSLKEKLSHLIEGREEPGIWKTNGEVGELLENTARLWLKGQEVDWNQLYRDEPLPSRIPLPPYTFAKMRCWFTSAPSLAIGTGKIKLHPLIDENISDINEYMFKTSFDNIEAIIRDHQVDHEVVLPGSAYLEMAQFTIGQIFGQPIRELCDIKWIKPFYPTKNRSLMTSVFPIRGDKIGFEMWTPLSDDANSRVIYCQGYALLSAGEDVERKLFEIAQIKEKCPKLIDSQTCYTQYRQNNFQYGPFYQSIKKINLGEDKALVEIGLNEQDSLDRFRLHPVLIDAAFQSPIAFEFDEKKAHSTFVPYELHSLKIIERLPSKLLVKVQKDHTQTSADQNVYHLSLIDFNGNLLAEIRGFKEKLFLKKSERAKRIGVLYGVPDWRTKKISGVEKRSEGTIKYLIATEPTLKLLRQALPKNETINCLPISLSEDPKDLVKDYISVFEKIQHDIKQRQISAASYQLYVDASSLWIAAPFLGLFRTLKIEKPSFFGKIIAIPNLLESSVKELRMLIEDEWQSPDTLVRYDENLSEREILQMKEVEQTSSVSNMLPTIKENGVYWLTGGLGGLGKIFLKSFASKNIRATVVLSGRTPINDEIEHACRTLSGSLNVHYLQCDISDRENVARTVKLIEEQFGSINGILHASGLIRDSLIYNKPLADIKEVFGPKLGIYYIDQATRHMPLDYVVLFSSDSSLFGNSGQSDYAGANSYLDFFAQQREAVRASQMCHGVTKVINWPLWKEGGLKVSPEVERMIFDTTGMIPLDTQNGIQAVEQILQSHYPQVLVMQGEIEQIRDKIFALGEKDKRNMRNDTKSDRQDPKLFAKTQQYFRNILSQELKLDQKLIELNSSFEDFGIDSIISINLIAKLERDFGSLSKTLFFECLTFSDLVQFFVQHYEQQLISLLAGSTPVEKAKPRHNGEEPISAAKTVSLSQISKNRKSQPAAQGPADMAIIGISGRYPKADNLDQLWQNLLQARNCIEEVPIERWDHSKYFDPVKKPGKSYSKWGGFINGVTEFDPLFFKISKSDAEGLEPQERLFLEEAWHAIEDAGYTRARLQEIADGKVGVFAGSMYQEYQLYSWDLLLNGNPRAISGSASSIANRVSFFLNVNGPSITLDTMCSSALTALYLACQSILHGDCKMAICGGVNVNVHPNKYVTLAADNFLSSEGLCKSFGKGGDGYVPSEGVGVIVIKPLAQAIADRDHVYGVIKAAEINHGGKVSGFTVPNPNAQAVLIKKTIEKSEVPVEAISYIEAHGTGTALGDPIEISGLSKGIGSLLQGKPMRCAIGSIKSNIGHCESAAGMAAIAKVVLQLEHQSLVPSIHCDPLNPNIDFNKLPFFVQKEVKPWPANSDRGRVALISSFGAGGSNACVVIEEYVAKKNKEHNSVLPSPLIFVLSALDDSRLKEYAKNLHTFLNARQGVSLVDLAYTLQIGRESFNKRLAVVFRDLPELILKLNHFIETDKLDQDVFQGTSTTLKSLASFDQFCQFVRENMANHQPTHLAELWTKGVDIPWRQLYSDFHPQMMSLPGYPFEREQCCIDLNYSNPNKHHQNMIHPLIHSNESNFYQQRYVSTFFGHEIFFEDHRVNGVKTMPGAVSVGMCVEATKKALNGPVHEVRDIIWLRPIQVQDQPTKLETILEFTPDQVIQAKVTSESGAVLSQCAVMPNPIDTIEKQVANVETITQRLDHVLRREEFYSILSNLGLELLESFKSIEFVSYSAREFLAEVKLSARAKTLTDQCALNPILLDAMFQSTAAITAIGDSGSSLPFSIDKLLFLENIPEDVYVYGYMKPPEEHNRVNQYDIFVIDQDGKVWMAVNGFKDRPISNKRIEKDIAEEDPIDEILQSLCSDEISIENAEELLLSF